LEDHKKEERGMRRRIIKLKEINNKNELNDYFYYIIIFFLP
jgi:hypothetical protein